MSTPAYIYMALKGMKLKLFFTVNMKLAFKYLIYTQATKHAAYSNY